MFDPLFEPYFGMRLIRDTAEAFSSDKKYIFGFHPHAIIPLAGGWCSHTSQWESQMPGVRPSVLTSSILHSIPIARDVIQFTGGRDVSRSSFKNAVQTVGSVLLIPGGQREMIGSSSKSLEIRIDVKHKGFVSIVLLSSSRDVSKNNESNEKYRYDWVSKWEHLWFPCSILEAIVHLIIFHFPRVGKDGV